MRPILLAALFLIPGCGGPTGNQDTPKPKAPQIDPATTGTIRGKAAFNGVPPKNPKLGMTPECAALHAAAPLDPVYLVRDGALQNVLVHVKSEMPPWPWPDQPILMSNENCLYVPRVIGVQVGQPVRFRNGDATDHNVHFETPKVKWNEWLRGKGSEMQFKPKHPEVIKVKCDVHTWMRGYIGVFPHPFFQVTGPDGAFELKGLPPGKYVIEAWHEQYGAKTATVDLPVKGEIAQDFTFP